MTIRTRTTFALAAALATASLALLAPAARAEDAPVAAAPAASAAAAIEVAKTYTATLQEGGIAPAVNKHWDFDTTIADAFGDHLKALTPEQLAETRESIATATRDALSNPTVMVTLVVGTYDNFKARDLDGGRVAVDYEMTFDGKANPCTLVFKKVGEQWRIVDSGTPGKMMGTFVKDRYAALIKETPATPLDFARAIVVTQAREQQQQLAQQSAAQPK